MKKSVAVYLADQNPHRDRSLGISRMTNCLLTELVKNKHFDLTAIISKSSYRFNNGSTVKKIEVPWNTDTIISRFATDNIHPFFLPQLTKADIWYYPKGYVPLFSRGNGITIVTIHDTIIQFYADNYKYYRSNIDYFYWISLLKRSIKRAEKILTISMNAKNQIMEFCKRHRLGSKNIDITFEGSDFESFEPFTLKDDDKYVVHLASSAPHKKTYHLIEWWHFLHSEGKSLPKLKLIGSLDRKAYDLATKTEGVSWLRYLKESDFVKTIGRASALILPSEIEGFGLPAIEAYFLGTPVCFAAGSSVEEILAVATVKGKFYLNDKESFYHALQQILELSPKEIQQAGNILRKKYSKRNFGLAVTNSFLDAL